jgi:hypothetical protein
MVCLLTLRLTNGFRLRASSRINDMAVGNAGVGRPSTRTTFSTSTRKRRRRASRALRFLLGARCARWRPRRERGPRRARSQRLTLADDKPTISPSLRVDQPGCCRWSRFSDANVSDVHFMPQTPFLRRAQRVACGLLCETRVLRRKRVDFERVTRESRCVDEVLLKSARKVV